MTLPLDSSADPLAVCVEAARAGGRVLREWRGRFAVSRKGPRDFVTEADYAAQREIRRIVAAAFPAHGFVGEEAEAGGGQPASGEPGHSGRGLRWIVDPLDGTSEFGEGDRDDWAVHIALWERDRGPRGDLGAAAVSLPSLQLTFSTNPAPPSPPRIERPPLLVVSRSRTPPVAAAVARELGCDGVRLGSAGAKTMAVVQGHVDIYLHAGGQHQWDSAAPVAVARAAGLHASRIDGSDFVYNERDTWLPDLVVCQPHLAQDVLRAVRNFTSR